MNALLLAALLVTADPDVEAMKRSLEVQIDVYSRLNALEDRVAALESASQVEPLIELPAPKDEVVRFTGDAAPTPVAEIERALDKLPKPLVGFVEPGCGPDARWAIAAAERWGVHAVGIEIDPARAAAARERVSNLGLDDKVTIITGDALEVDWKDLADVGGSYLYGETLTALAPRLKELRGFASYMHQPGTLAATKYGNTYVWTKPVAQPVVQQQQQVGVWYNGAWYTSANGNCNCAMCQYIRGQLAAQRAAQPVQQPQAYYSYSYSYVSPCANGRCNRRFSYDD